MWHIDPNAPPVWYISTLLVFTLLVWGPTLATSTTVLPNGDGSNSNPGTGLRKVVLEYIADPTATTITYGDISQWDTSAITNMRYLFYNTAFNGDISSWQTGAVTNMGNSK